MQTIIRKIRDKLTSRRQAAQMDLNHHPVSIPHVKRIAVRGGGRTFGGKLIVRIPVTLSAISAFITFSAILTGQLQPTYADPVTSTGTIGADIAYSITMSLGGAYAAANCTAKTGGGSAVTINAAPDGKIYYACLNALVTTTDPWGYTLSMKASTANLVSGSNTIGATNGTIAAPVALANDKWGFCIPATAMQNVTNGFDTTLASACGGADGSTASAIKYAPVPTADTTIKNISTAPSTDLEKNTPIRFGVKPTSAIATGSYTTTVTITATPNAVPYGAPTVTAISPTSGDTAGGDTVTITGTNFMYNSSSVVTGVTIGTYTCGSISVASATSLTCVTGAATAGTYAVNVTNASGTGTLASAFTYATAPTTTYIQTITTSNCPTTRTRVADARDSHSYWVQKIGSTCWMLTNLSYAGGGTNTYSDVKTITNSETLDYTNAYYMIPTGANPTTEPTDPSTSTSGTGQYGYLYNWCAAMGVQTSTSACANGTTLAPNASISICPSGWRLPTGNGGEFGALNTAINSGSTSTDAGLRTSWFAMYGGVWNSGYYNQGSCGDYWSSTQNSATSAYNLYFYSTNVNPAGNYNKRYGRSIRCVAN